MNHALLIIKNVRKSRKRCGKAANGRIKCAERREKKKNKKRRKKKEKKEK